MRNKKIPFYIDIIFCFVLLPVMIMLLPVERWIANNTFSAIIFIIWLYAVYFINRFATVPLLFGKKKTVAGTVVLLLTFVVAYFIINSLFDFHGHHRGGRFVGDIRFLPRMRIREQGMWFMFFVVTCFSFAVGLFTELVRQMLKSKELEVQRDKAELSLYKAQINPHFLFNTLNSLYGLLITGSDKSETAFMQFIGMLKYMYSNGDKEKLPVREEAEYIRRYIELQKLRLNEHTSIIFECVNTSDEERCIASMLLITFVENAFKYGVSSHKDSCIKIGIAVDGDILNFYTENSIMKYTDEHGLGIENCRKRLDMLYRSHYMLKIKDEDGIYRVDLSLDL